MPNAIDGLKPEQVWRNFAEISKVPRGSTNEKRISQFVLNKAKHLGLEAKQDKVLNVVVRKKAAPGKENLPMVCLQGHMDMVCEKNKDKVHDFEKDPIEIVRKGNVLTANGTTLGADNGIGVATNLAIMEDKTLVHGPLEFLFTVDEESGLTGANGLKAGILQSKILLNLDSEEEGALYVGCAGGRNTVGTWTVRFEKPPAKSAPMLLQVRGLKGGHSGLEIDKGRGNAIKILNRVLVELLGIGARISHVEGGNKSNAIPREAEALLYVPKDKSRKAKAIVEGCQKTVKAELATVDPDLTITIGPAPAQKKPLVFRKSLEESFTKTLAGLPHGVIKMSAEIQGLVETSTNLAVIRTEKAKLIVTTSQRSSVASEIDDLTHSVAAIFELGGAKAEHVRGYPGWKPNMSSPILNLAKNTYKELYGRKPHVKAVHAGLECGIIGEKYPEMDMVSFGPTLEGVHSPDEKIYIDSVEKFWNYLLALLRNIH